MSRLIPAILTIIAAASVAIGAPPLTMNFQGSLLDDEGFLMPDGNYGVTFRIFTTASGGTAIWTESQTVAVSGSVFHAVLGETNDLNLAFDRQYYLSVQVAADPQMSPRIPLTASPYALNVADGKVVKSLNGMTDDVTLTGGANVTITPSGNNLTISAAGGSGLTLPYLGICSSSSTALAIRQDGTGRGGHFYIDNEGNVESVLTAARGGGSGEVLYLGNTSASTGTVFYCSNFGTGPTIQINVPNFQTAADVFELTSGGTGRGIDVSLTRSSNSNEGLYVNTAGTGHAGKFAISSTSSSVSALVVTSSAVGRGQYIGLTRTTNPSQALYVETAGTGRAGHFRITNPSSGSHSVSASTQGSGAALEGYTSGTGHAGLFHVNNTGNDEAALYVATNGSGNALHVVGGSGYTARFEGNTPTWAVVTAHHSGNGAALQGTVAEGTALRTSNSGDGDALDVRHYGASGNFAVFRTEGLENQIRFNLNGRGYFNGGYQSGGADVAEAFEVEGSTRAYEPGDVIAISQDSDQRVQKSGGAYSTLVVGVYATKPGVLLTERHIDESMDDTIPVGVVGVIPTKVSGENGPIRRGDLLVASRIPGHAMKGTDRDQMLGSIIGKALQNFTGRGTGVIKVMVNTR